MRYIIEGDEKVLERVLREQRIRIGRGQLKAYPASGFAPVEDVKDAEITDSKALPLPDTKETKPEDSKAVSETDDKEPKSKK